MAEAGSITIWLRRNFLAERVAGAAPARSVSSDRDGCVPARSYQAWAPAS